MKKRTINQKRAAQFDRDFNLLAIRAGDFACKDQTHLGRDREGWAAVAKEMQHIRWLAQTMMNEKDR